VFASSGRASVVELRPGDLGFVPMGYGHALENVGDEPAEALFIMNSGKYEEISFSGWLASNPNYVLETNFPGVPASVIDRLPRGERFFVGPQP
jgi:oxalate decarboxylase